MELGITNLYKYIQSKKSNDPDFQFLEYEVAEFFMTMINAHAHL
jgi:translation initiation factor 2-alpha kinase 4